MENGVRFFGMGVPKETFEQAGRQQFIELLAAGLLPESRVLEFGCGCMRIGYWLIQFLDPECFYGIEPAKNRVEHGREYLFSPAMLAEKKPQFDYNAVFDSSMFQQQFDFFLARSIWTHASKRQIEATLDSFVRDASESAVFLASYFPPESPADDYMGDQWVGTSHESDELGIVRHSLAWIQSQCLARGLVIEEREGLDCDSQCWLHIRRESPPTQAE
ncbi:hypothetical protein [Rubinisphaera sp.]|uniref:hypothetical protein n=1 Tax=Rubinisphaera sp. TaxID=2024857 RepID=UPI000C11A5CA|nr:hypothetical protein [Rubinisphaera sp.]MBV11990.1 hypothetical protein [Rubinisphaera sp.]HCS55092.1 hypothetical protein [Planctomycetaceae bacterium]|tara:strand:- start:7733 stop:8386 length:654 start_codon:yes stop_codon:yes gene_type:complete